MEANTCYWCGKEATTKEHVPPKCLFPEEKDIRDVFADSYRNNLITVPSCELHNTKKSHNDEYLLACICGIVGNNSVAFIHNSTKVKRAIERNPHLISISENDTIEIGEMIYPVQWANIDNGRLISSFESIGRALYFHEYNRPFEGRIKVVSNIFQHIKAIEWTKFNVNGANLIELEQPTWATDVKGENEKIFTYQFSPIDDFGTQTLALNFYEGTKIYVIFSTFDFDKFRENNPKFHKLSKEMLGLDE